MRQLANLETPLAVFLLWLSIVLVVTLPSASMASSSESLSSSLPKKTISLTEDEESEYLESVNSPEALEIRRYLDLCLSQGPMPPYDRYPCEAEGVDEGTTIREHSIDHVNGPFAILSTQEIMFGGIVFTIMVSKPPYLAVDVWVYPEGGIDLDVRSFQVSGMTVKERVEMARFLRTYLTKPGFTR